MENNESQFNVLYSHISSEKHALKIIREASIFFAIIASVQLLIIAFNSFSYVVLIPGVILLMLAAFLYKKRSTLAAIILIVLTSIDLILLIFLMPKSLSLIWMAKVAAIILSIRALQATNYIKKSSLITTSLE